MFEKTALILTELIVDLYREIIGRYDQSVFRVSLYWTTD